MAKLIWLREIISNPDSLSLVNTDGWAIAHVWKGNNRLWCACTDDGAVITQNVPRAKAIRVAYETMHG